MKNKKEYIKISEKIVSCVGGLENIQGTAHCATRLRIVLKDNNAADIEKLENIEKVKGAFIAGNQLQLIFGAGTVNDVYEVFAEYTHTENMSLGELKEKSAQNKILFRQLSKHYPMYLSELCRHCWQRLF